MSTAGAPMTEKSTMMKLVAISFTKNFTVHNAKLLKCPLCNVKCKYGNMKSHLKKHIAENCKSCPKCGFRVKIHNAYNMCNHMMSHLDFKPFSCLKCSKEIKHKRDMIQHLKIFHGVQYKCPYCEKQFKPYPSMKKHLLSHVLRKDKKDNSERNLNEKSPDIGLTDNRVECDNSSDSECSDDIQILETSNDNIGSPLVSNRFHSETKMQLNNDVPSADISSCTYGEKFEPQTANFERNGDSDYSTSALQADFSRECTQISNESSLDSCKVVSNQSDCMITKSDELVAFSFTKNFTVHNAKLLKCPLCNIRCKYGNMKSHLTKHIAENCKSCPKCGFCVNIKYASSMSNHVMSHLDFKPFSCLKCSKESKHERDMIKHLKNFHGVKYKCPYCEKQFKLYRSMKKHVSSHMLRKANSERNLNEKSPDIGLTDNRVECDISSDSECSDDIQILETSNENIGSPLGSNRFYSETKMHLNNDVPSAEISSCTFGKKFEPETANCERNGHSDYSTLALQADFFRECAQISNESSLDSCKVVSDQSDCMITKSDEEIESGSPKYVGSSAFSLTPQIRRDVFSIEKSQPNEFLPLRLPHDEQQERCLSLWFEQEESESHTQKQDGNFITFLAEDDHTLQTHRIEPEWILNGDDDQYSIALLYEKLVINSWMRK